MHELTDKTLDRFWSQVDRRGDDECWEWQGAKTGDGYGGFWDGTKSSMAHRVSFVIANGITPNVCRHTCDNRSCVNPNHLLDGTQADNVRDAVERGRQGRYVGNPVSRPIPTCDWCSEPIKNRKRINRKQPNYCKRSCKIAAYRERKRTQQ